MGFLIEKRGLSEEMIKSAKIGWDGQRYCIPIIDADNQLVNVRRYDPTDDNKVISLGGRGKARLYSPFDPPRADSVVLVTEGELDCLKAAQELDDVWVVSGTGGAGVPPSDDELEPLRSRAVFIAYDCDKAGATGALKLAARLESIASIVRVVDLGLGAREDITDWFVTHRHTAAELLDRMWRARFYWAGDLVVPRPVEDIVSGAVQEAHDSGSRNEGLFWLATQMRDERYSKAETIDTALGSYRDGVAGMQEVPTTEAEVRSTVNSAFTEPSREPRGALGGNTSTSTLNGPRYKLVSPGELAEPIVPLEWLIRGVWPRGSYGPLGGAKKTLKTYIASVFAIAVAAGRPAFNNDEWSVPEARPVIYYGGEGGREMHKRRLQRIASDVYGIADLRSLPFYLVTDVGPFDRPDFADALVRNLAEVNAAHPDDVALVVLDSLYNYHPADVDVSNLYDRGRLLGALSVGLVERGVALWIVDHFNKTGSGIDLDRLAQAGMSAWADSWLLFEHATEPDIGNGKFAISTGLGSRQWGGEEWTLHIDIGPFDKESSGYLTAMKVEAEPGITKRARGSGDGATDSEVDAGVHAFIEHNPDSTKTEIIDGVMADVSVGRSRATRRFAHLVASGGVTSERRTRTERGRTSGVKREVWDSAPLKVSLKEARAAGAGNPTHPGRVGRSGRVVGEPDPQPDPPSRRRGAES